MGEKLDNETIDQIAPIIKKYLNYEESTDYHFVLNDIACWDGNIHNNDDAKLFQECINRRDAIKSQHERLTILFDQIVKQAKEAAS